MGSSEAAQPELNGPTTATTRASRATALAVAAQVAGVQDPAAALESSQS
jgi:hypothetical protein